jgi:hypothetical protein
MDEKTLTLVKQILFETIRTLQEPDPPTLAQWEDLAHELGRVHQIAQLEVVRLFNLNEV